MVKTGYKQTQLGEIPDEWDVGPLNSLCSLFCDGDWIESKDQSNEGIRLIQTGNVGVGKFINKADKKHFISEETFNKLHCIEIFPGDILVSRLPDPIGRACIIPNTNEKMITAVDCAIIRFYEYSSKLFVGFTQTKIYANLVNATIGGSTRQRVTRKDLGKIPIPIPTISEQQAIATALSDVDELIVKLEKLIAKKKAIKHGAMQELLSGEKRLPGFGGEWAQMIIGENGYLQKGSINPQLQPDQYFYEYSMPAFDESRKPSHVQGKTMHSNRTVIHGKVLLFNKLNVRQKRIWLIDECEEDAICSAEFLPYSSEKIDLGLLSQILFTDAVTDDFIGMSTGSSNSQKRITPKSFLEYSLYLPTDGEEQKALADVFEDMDQEISALQSKMEKYQQLKQGMMQKLLSGEIRLV